MQKYKFLRYFILIAALLLLSGLSIAQDLPVFRIGVLDNATESVSRGARLAVEQINRAGGVTGADGTEFQLELVVQSTDNMNSAINALNSASVIAVIGPAQNDIALGNLSPLQRLNVPILTLATDDTLLIQDLTERLIRVRAQEAARGRALSNYLLSDFENTPVSTVQLDLESTAGLVGFTAAYNGSGTRIVNEFLLEGDISDNNFIEDVADANAPLLVVYGAPDLVREFYTRLIATGWDGRLAYNHANHEDFKSGLSDEQLAGIIGATTWSYASNDDSSRAFVADYAAFYDDVPDEIAAAAYDAVFMIDRAVSEPGNLVNNLNTIESLEGVQGLLQPALLPDGESSSQTMVFETTGYGGQMVLARYAGDIRLEDEILTDLDIVVATFTPTPGSTATPVPTATPDGVTLTITRTVQNIRTGPGLEYDVIGQLNQGEQRPIVGANVDISWIAINYRGQIGWLSAGILDIFGNRNLIPILPIPPTPTPPPTALPTSTSLPPAIADIVITAAQPNRLTAGQPFNVSVTVRNQGFANAGGFAVATSLMPGSVYAAQNLTGLTAGQSTVISLTGTLGTATGQQNIVIVADLNDQVPEGTAGEANNGAFTYSYMVDAPIFSTGPLTLANGASVSLDGGTADINWSGGTLSPVGGTTLVTLNGFSSFDSVHRDAIAGSALSGTPINTVPVGALIGILTDGGALYGVIEVTGATVGGNLSFNFRVYS